MSEQLHPQFREEKSVDAANLVDMSIYRFEGFSNSRDKYIFVKRRGK